MLFNKVSNVSNSPDSIQLFWYDDAFESLLKWPPEMVYKLLAKYVRHGGFIKPERFDKLYDKLSREDFAKLVEAEKNGGTLYRAILEVCCPKATKLMEDPKYPFLVVGE